MNSENSEHCKPVPLDCTLEARLDAMRKRANHAEMVLAQYENALEKINHQIAIDILRKWQASP